MQKIIHGLLLQLIFLTSQAQEIQFKCYLRSNCDGSFKELQNYQLQKKDFQYFSLNSGTIASLPDTGIYILRSYYLAVEGDSMLVYIGYGLNIDTIKQVDIYESIILHNNESTKEKAWSGWLCCGKKCEGFNVDYYNNGNKRLEGKFKKGKPVSDLKAYNGNGKLRYIEYYNKRGKKIRSEEVKN